VCSSLGLDCDWSFKTTTTFWIRFVIGCFNSKWRLWSLDTLKIVVETWVISMLADDPYAYLNAQKYSLCIFLQFDFLSLRSLDYRAPTWVRWIVCGNGCLWLFSFITIFVLNCWVLLLLVTGLGCCPPIQGLYFLLFIKTCPVFFLFINDKHIVLLKNNSLLFISKIFIIIPKMLSLFFFFYIYLVFLIF